MDASQLLMRMKHFVRSTEKPSTSSVVNNEFNQAHRTAFVSGSHVKQFYESTVGKEAFQTNQKKCTKGKPLEKPKPSTKLIKTAFNVNSLMKAVEMGKTADVEEILEKNKESVNCCDQFGWTPIMSACCAGNERMVVLLLQWKPDLSVCDKRGQSCRDLASAKGYRHIVKILDQYVQDMHENTVAKQNPTSSEQVPSNNTTFYCKVCKQSIEHTSMKKHLSSTIHNFHKASKRKMPTMYGIPESNKGFQILVKSGWNKEDGLGPSGEGHKYPPKTILKQDRTGLGAKRYQARVTHTLEDSGRKEVRQKKTFKRDLKMEKTKEQRLERNLRRMLS
ncbi:G patch domain and ankyrin repeat-containing protein 1 [Homalodisca vitripennis]|nr:G patch domain and ankyrin repeat-containing protein 1 [Homalodisca vitripennis]